MKSWALFPVPYWVDLSQKSNHSRRNWSHACFVYSISKSCCTLNKTVFISFHKCWSQHHTIWDYAASLSISFLCDMHKTGRVKWKKLHFHFYLDKMEKECLLTFSSFKVIILRKVLHTFSFSFYWHVTIQLQEFWQSLRPHNSAPTKDRTSPASWNHPPLPVTAALLISTPALHGLPFMDFLQAGGTRRTVLTWLVWLKVVGVSLPAAHTWFTLGPGGIALYGYSTIVYQSSYRSIIRFLHIFPIMNKAAMKSTVKTVCRQLFSFLYKYLSMKELDPMVVYVLFSVEMPVFPSGCTTVCSDQQWMRVPVAPFLANIRYYH